MIAPWLADCAMPTRFSAGSGTSARLVNVRDPVTVHVGAERQVQHGVDVEGAGGRDGDFRRRAGAKFTRLNSMRAGPASATSSRYVPRASVVAVTRPPSSVRNSTDTPGSAPPVSSRTVPETSAAAAPLVMQQRSASCMTACCQIGV